MTGSEIDPTANGKSTAGVAGAIAADPILETETVPGSIAVLDQSRQPGVIGGEASGRTEGLTLQMLTDKRLTKAFEIEKAVIHGSNAFPIGAVQIQKRSTSNPILAARIQRMIVAQKRAVTVLARITGASANRSAATIQILAVSGSRGEMMMDNDVLNTIATSPIQMTPAVKPISMIQMTAAIKLTVIDQIQGIIIRNPCVTYQRTFVVITNREHGVKNLPDRIQSPMMIVANLFGTPLIQIMVVGNLFGMIKIRIIDPLVMIQIQMKPRRSRGMVIGTDTPLPQMKRGEEPRSSGPKKMIHTAKNRKLHTVPLINIKPNGLPQKRGQTKLREEAGDLIHPAAVPETKISQPRGKTGPTSHRRLIDHLPPAKRWR